MAKDIKVNFTEEEILEYINELNNAKGNNRKINKLLDLSHLPILVAYLRKIGVSEELLSLAAVVEFTRYKIKDILTSDSIKEWNVTDTGIEFEKYDKFPHPEKLGVDSADTFWLGNEKYFGRNMKEIHGVMWPADSYIYLKRKMYSYRDIDRPINRWGFAFCRFYFCGKISVWDKIEKEDGIKYFITKITDIGGVEIERKRIYAGEPIDLLETENTLKDNYEMYTTLFPKYKEWLDIDYADNFDEKVRVVDSEIYKEKIPKLVEKNDICKKALKEEFEKYKENEKKLEELEEYLSGFKCENDDGINAIESIKVEVNSRLTVDEENIESVLDSTNLKDSNVEPNDLSYEELKEKTERLTAEVDSIEDLIELLREVNISNGILIENIRNKIKEIGMKKEENARDVTETEEER